MGEPPSDLRAKSLSGDTDRHKGPHQKSISDFTSQIPSIVVSCGVPNCLESKRQRFPRHSECLAQSSTRSCEWKFLAMSVSMSSKLVGLWSNIDENRTGKRWRKPSDSAPFHSDVHLLRSYNPGERVTLLMHLRSEAILDSLSRRFVSSGHAGYDTDTGGRGRVG